MTKPQPVSLTESEIRELTILLEWTLLDTNSNRRAGICTRILRKIGLARQTVAGGC